MIKRRQNGDATRTRKVKRPMRMQEICIRVLSASIHRILGFNSISLLNPSTLHDDNRHRVTCLLTRPRTRTFCSLWPVAKAGAIWGQAYSAKITQSRLCTADAALKGKTTKLSLKKLSKKYCFICLTSVASCNHSTSQNTTHLHNSHPLELVHAFLPSAALLRPPGKGRL